MIDDRRSPTVLLVEDEQDCRWLWRMLLDGDERFGVVSEAASSEEALDVLMRDFPDIVITDVHMPGGGGRAVLDFLRSRHPRPIIVATSASADLATQTSEYGAAAFWTKVESVSSDMTERLWRLWQQRQDPRTATASSRDVESRCDRTGG